MQPARIIEITAKTGVQPHIDAALSLRSTGRYEEALQELESSREYNAYLYTIRGEIEYALGRFHDAALSFSSVVQSEPDNADGHYNLALCLQRSNRWDASCAAFERVLSIDSARDSARLGVGASLLYLNRLDEALSAFEACSDGARIPALFGKAVTLQLLHRFGEAEITYEALLTLDPDSEELLSNLIALNIETANYDRVRDFSQRLLRIGPQSPVALQGLATVALHRADHHAAARHCDRILQLAPGCLEAWHNLHVALNRILAGFSVPKPIPLNPGVK